MAYAINLLMVWLLQDMLKLTKDQLDGVMEISRYTCFVYFESWFRAPFVSDSAFLDLRTYKLLTPFSKYDC